MKVYGKLTEIFKLILRKSGYEVTIDAPTSVSGTYSFKLPDVAASGSDELVTKTASQTLTNKTLSAPTVSDLSNMQHDHTASGSGGVLLHANLSGAGTNTHSQIDSHISTATTHINTHSEAQIVTVAKSGGMYSTIQAAIDAITDATSTKQYVVLIAPGVYTEDVTGKPFVHLVGTGGQTSAVRINGHVVMNFGSANDTCTIKKVACTRTITGDGQACLDTTGITAEDSTFTAAVSADYLCYGINAALTKAGLTLRDSAVAVSNTFNGSTKNMTALEISGTLSVLLSRNQFLVAALASSGELEACHNGTTGRIASQSNTYQISSAKSGFSGTACGILATTASTGVRTSDSDRFILTGTGNTGTANVFCLNSSGSSAEMYYTGCIVQVSGFANEYVTNTAATDIQKVWLNSTNKDIGKTGAGLAVVTPYDEQKSGFISWAGSGTYWSSSGANLSVLIKSAGCVKDAPVTSATGTVALTQYTTGYVYADSTGALGVTNTASEALYANNVVLLEAYYDGTNILVAKENHPYKFTTNVAHAWHRVFGSLLVGTGAVLTNIGALPDSNRTIKIVGADTLVDHGLDTTIPDSAGAAVNFIQTYTDGSSRLILATPATAIPTKYNNSGTLTNCPNNNFCVMRIGAIKDNLNSSSPQYIAHVDTTTYGNISAARTAVSANSVAIFPAELAKLEIVQLGFAILKGNGSGAGTLEEITVSKQVFGASFSSAAASTSAALSNTSTTNFDKLLSSADTTVQLALETIDEKATIRVTGTTDNTLPRFDGASGTLQNSGVIVDDSNNVSGTTFWSTGTGASKLPVGTTAQRPGSPAQGMLRFNSSSNKAEIYDGSSWTTAGGGSNIVSVSDASHGFVAGDVGKGIYKNTNTDPSTTNLYALAKADSSTTAELIGVLSKVIDTNTFEYTSAGEITGLSGLTTGSVYFLSDATAGLLTATEPTTVGNISLPVMVATSATTAVINIMRGTVIGGTNVYTSIPLATGVTTLQSIADATIFPSGTGGFIQGAITIAATGGNYVTTFKVEFAKPVTGTAYTCTPTYGCDALPSGTSIDITSGGLIQLTLPAISGFTSGTAKFSMQAAAIGAQLPLQIASSRVTWDVTTLSDADATQLGLKQYLHGTTYNGGNAPTVSAGTGITNIGTVTRAVFVPYKVQDGTWRLRFTIRIDGATSASRVDHQIAINGILSKNTSGYIQAVTGWTTDVDFALVVFNTNTVRIDSKTSTTPTVYSLAGDIELESKPTWAY